MTMAVGTAMKKTILHRGISESQAAREIGASQKVVNDWVAGRFNPRPNKLAKIIVWLGKHNRKLRINVSFS